MSRGVFFSLYFIKYKVQGFIQKGETLTTQPVIQHHVVEESLWKFQNAF